MWSLCKKEFRQFFSSLTGYVALSAYLLLTGLLLFVFPDTNLLEEGYASLERFFELSPWILLMLIPAITMRSFADEYRSGTFELLKTRPLRDWEIIGGKFLGALLVVWLALVPTLLYAFSIQQLSSTGGIDRGATAGSYLGLGALAAIFTAVGVCFSSFTRNTVVAFLLTAFACFFLYSGFTALSRIPAFSGGADYYLELLSVDYHYRSISRGIVDTRDLVYFFSVGVFFLSVTYRNIANR